MTILNIMLGRKLGGLEQAALDYAEALRHAGLDVLNIATPEGWFAHALHGSHQTYAALPNFGGWDPLAAARLRMLAKQCGATAMICHGNRALSLALRACKGRLPIIGVAHNVKIEKTARADAFFCVTQRVREAFATDYAIPSNKLFFMPNMVHAASPASRPTFRSPPVIGAMGRFVPVKGFDLLIEACALLRDRGLMFHVKLAGLGEQEAALRAAVTEHQLTDHVTFTGWVRDKTAFFESIDLCVVPSREEAFGLVLLEAMSHRVPLLATAVTGPREIITEGVDGRLVPPSDPEALAEAIAAMLADEAAALAMANAARLKVESEYSLSALSARLRGALTQLGAVA